MLKRFCLGILLTAIFAHSLLAQEKAVFLLAGQSNAQGIGGKGQKVFCLPNTAYEYDVIGDSICPLLDPVGQNWKTLSRSGGSICPAFAREYHAWSGKKVYMVTATRGGSSCHVKAELGNYNTWAVSGSLFKDAVEKTEKAIQCVQTPLTGIIWMQGERDANAILDGKLSGEEYADALKDVISRFRLKFGSEVPFYIVLTGYQQDRASEGCKIVREMQTRVAKKMKNVFVAFSDTDLFPARGWFADHVHYNQDGLNEVGATVARFVLDPNETKRASHSLESGFRNLPITARPYVWWHWLGSNFSKEGITKDLEAMKAEGVGGATIFNIASAVEESHVPTLNNPWPEQTYRSPAYWEAVLHAAKEAKRLGLELGLHNTVGYSTTGGPWVDEERGMQRVVFTRIDVEGGTDVRQKLKQGAPPVYKGWGSFAIPAAAYHDIAVLAVPDKKMPGIKEVINVSRYMMADGSFSWDAPAGKWSIYRIGYAPTKSNPHPVPDDLMGKAFEIDKMSRKQNQYHWNQVLKPVKQHLGSYLGKTLKHVLIDSYEAGRQSWTPTFRADFIRLMGYDPISWMVTLGQPILDEMAAGNKRFIESEELTQRFEWDYRYVVATLFHRNGWLTAKEMLHKAQLQLYMEPYTGPFCTATAAAAADVPMGEFWTFGQGSIKSVISAAARAAGKTIVGAEAFTSTPTGSAWTEDPAFLKYTADGAYASGVNRLILHHWVHQPFDDKYQPGMGMGWWGTHFNRHQTWFEPGKAFFSYLTRIQYLLQQGEEVADYLCLNEPVGHSDVISESDFLEQTLVVKGGRILLSSGRSYPLMVFPNNKNVRPEVLRKMRTLVKQGAIIVAEKPLRSPSLVNYPQCDKEVSDLAKEMWTGEDIKAYGKGFVITKLDAAKQYLGITPDWTFDAPGLESDIKIVHRSSTEAQIYFITNRTKENRAFTLSLRQQGLLPELWDPEKGTMYPVSDWVFNSQRTDVKVALSPSKSFFIIFRKQATLAQIEEGSRVKTTPLLTSEQTLHGAWDVSFTPKLGQPFKRVFHQLIDFSQNTDSEVMYFSGTATYRKHFTLHHEALKQPGQVYLSLGEMNDIASVKLNGMEVGTLWYPPYKVDVTSFVKDGENLLEISVTNNWANRLIGDEQEPADFEWGSDRGKKGRAMKSYPEWFLKNESRPSSRQGFVIWYYHKKDSPLQKAGLVGPVKILY